MTVTCERENQAGDYDRRWSERFREPSSVSTERGDALGSIAADVARESTVLLALLRKLVDEVSDGAALDTEATAVLEPGLPTTGTASGSGEKEVGTSLGRYRIREFIRAGGMGEIYSAVDERLGRTVALKVLPGHLCANNNRRRRLLDEAKLLSAVSHPHICTLFDVGHARGVDYLVMEYLEGQSLADRLAAGHVTLSQAIRIGSQMACALEAAHRAGIVHRDLKPANIMLSGRPEEPDPRVKILDFGLARVMGKTESDSGEHSRECPTKTDVNNVEGTCPYMAPEQFVNGEVDPRTDIWALGVVLYEMVCGWRPFQGSTPAALMTGILWWTPKPPSEVGGGCSRQLSRVIERCLEKDKSRRWSSCAELATALDDLALSEAADSSEVGIGRGPLGLLKRLGAAALVCGVLMAAPAPSAGQPIPVDRLDRPQMEEFLSRGEVTELRRLSTGVTGSSRAVVTWNGASHDAHVQSVDEYFSPGSRTVNLSDRYTYNVAAYRLDKLLDLNMVPVSVQRVVKGRAAAVTWWIDDVVMMEIERRKLQLQPPRPATAWSDQMRRAYIFQELISNSDFNQTNMLITREWRLWLIDFTRAFREYRKLEHPDRIVKIDRRLYEALGRLDETTLRAEMKGLLTNRQIRAIVARRDLLMAYLAKKETVSTAAATRQSDLDRRRKPLRSTNVVASTVQAIEEASMPHQRRSASEDEDTVTLEIGWLVR